MSRFTSSTARLPVYLGYSSSSPYISAIEIPITEITKIKLVADGATTPPYFLGSTSSNYILSWLKSIELKGITEIGDWFGFHSLRAASVILPPTIRRIGSSFIRENNSFVGPIYVPLGVPAPTDEESLSVASADALAYASGVVLTGPGAAAWKAALPDRTTAPYRKLVIG